jgi:hypothetical protein
MMEIAGLGHGVEETVEIGRGSVGLEMFESGGEIGAGNGRNEEGEESEEEGAEGMESRDLDCHGVE